jgi:hypothetical protein
VTHQEHTDVELVLLLPHVGLDLAAPVIGVTAGFFAPPVRHG